MSRLKDKGFSGSGEKPCSGPEELLRRGMSELCLKFSHEQVSRFLRYLSDICKWNKAYNLTAVRTEEDIVLKHFLDSLLYMRALPEGPISVIDVGSGAGFPGIPIKIMRPDITLYLLEPSRKKANFLSHVVRTLGLKDTGVIVERVEALRTPAVDVALTRALFDIRDFWKKASGLVRPGGRLILSKGPKVREELLAVRGQGLELETIDSRLPVAGIIRTIVIIHRPRPGEASGPAPQKQGKAAAYQTVCVNAECRLRSAGCRGFAGCPGFRAAC